MIALRKTAAAFGAELVSLDTLPAPGMGQLVIKVVAAAICGSDIHAYEWTPGYEFMSQLMPITLGHEFSGVVDAVGEGVADFRPGDRVTCWPTKSCGHCHVCKAGRPQECTSRSIIGLQCDGGFADMVAVPAVNCRHLPAGLDLEVAALSEPLSIAVNAVDVADVTSGDRVVVLGCGPIGLGIAWVAASRGADVLLAGFNDAARLSIAPALGILRTVDLAEICLSDAVAKAFGQQVDRVIEATGVPESLVDGLAVLRTGGILVTAGIHSKPLQLDLTRFVREKKQLRAAHDTTPRGLEQAIRLLGANAETLRRLITHRLPLSQAVEAFEIARSRQAVKVLLLPDGARNQSNGAAP